MIDRARELGSYDTAERLKKARAQRVKLSNDAKMDWDQEKMRVKKFAQEVMR